MDVQHQIQQLSVKMEELGTRSSPKHWQAMEEKLSVYLLDELEQKLNAQKESAMDELLELRLSVLLNKKMQVVDEQIKQLRLEMQKINGQQAANSAVKVGVERQDVKTQESFLMSEKVSRHLDQLIEENAQFAIKIQQIRQLSVWTASAAGASLLISLMHYAFS